MSSGSSLFSTPIPGIVTAAAIYARGASILFFGNNLGTVFRCNVSSTPHNFQTLQLPVSLGPILGIAVNGQFLYIVSLGVLYQIDIVQNVQLFSYSTADQSTIVVTNGVVDITPAGFIPSGGVAVTASNDIYLAVNNSQLISIRSGIVNVLVTSTSGTLYVCLAIDAAEQYLYFSNKYNGVVYSYNIADNVKNAVLLVTTGQDWAQGVSSGSTVLLVLRTPNAVPYEGRVHAVTLQRDVIVAGGGTASSGDPQYLRIRSDVSVNSAGFAIDPETGFLYVSSYNNPGSIMYMIEFAVLQRPLPTVAPPKQKQINCGLAEFGTCKRVTIPFSPREYWGWGSPNRPYLTPDPNVGCVPAHVYIGDHPCPDVRQPILPIPPPPPPVPPPVIVPSTERATTDFASRSFNYLTTGISSLTLVATISTSSLEAPSAPGLGPYGELYMLTSNGNIYSLYAGLSNSTGDSLVDTSPAISITSGNVVVATANKVTAFDPSLNVLWSSNIAGCYSPAFGGGNTVFLTDGPNIYAIDSATQSNVWTFRFNGNETATSPPSTDSGILLLGTSTGNVYSFDQTSGNIIWRYSTGLNKPVYSAPNYTWNDRVIFACSNAIYNIDYDRIPPYNRTRVFVNDEATATSSFATSFDPSGNLWCYFTGAAAALFGVCMLDDSGNYLAWTSSNLPGTDVITPNMTPTLDPLYVYVTSQRGRVMRYLAFPSGLVQNNIVQKSYVDLYFLPESTVSPSVVTTASNQLVVFDAVATTYIFQ